MTHAGATPLDAAHARMQAAPGDDSARMRFYGEVVASMLVVLLDTDAAAGDAIAPATFEVEGARYVLAFDREERLTAFVGAAAPYAALPARVLVRMLTEEGQGIGLALNLGAVSGVLLPPGTVAWLVDNPDAGPERTGGVAEEFFPPAGVPEGMVLALDRALARATGLAGAALLAGVRYRGGEARHLLAVIDTAPGAEASLVAALDTAVRFSGSDAVPLDIVFLAAGDARIARLERVGLRFDLPETAPAVPERRRAPGDDPDRPPILK